MPDKGRSGRGQGQPGGDQTGDLFAFQRPESAPPPSPTPNVPPTPPTERDEARAVARPPRGIVTDPRQAADAQAPAAANPDPATTDFSPPVDSIPARMLNEYVYCRRLFYYEHVQGVFVESADTVRGETIHKRVDKGSGAMPIAKKASAPAADETQENAPPADAGEEIHSRSVMLGSDRLGVVAKLDLVEASVDETGGVTEVCPVDYKAGSPREGTDGPELWDTDRMQLGLQCLLLRDNGYRCGAGIIYYRATKQRVRLNLTPDLETWILSEIAAARETALGPIPPPLVDSPKCVRCSLAPVCLPDETRMLAVPTLEKWWDDTASPTDPSLVAAAESAAGIAPPRRLMALRDDRKTLYLNTPGVRVGCHDAVIKVKEKERLVQEVRVSNVSHVAIFGNIQVSTQAVQKFCDKDIPVTWFSLGGWFYGLTRGHSLKNVLVRIEQFRHAADPSSCLRLAQQFVRGKIHNHRVLFMRNHAERSEWVKLRLGQAREDALATRSLGELLGVEGAAAAVYFQQFAGLIRERVEDAFLDGIEPAARPQRTFTFDFKTRNRRPPTDPVNAMLSLAYSLLAKECTLAAYVVGLDPYVGFYHQPRHGRPALALDLMEEFRPLIAESAVLTAINNSLVSVDDFVSAGQAINLNSLGRKRFFNCFEQRMDSLIIHPVFGYKVSYRRAIELQFRILARVLSGEIPEYIPFLTR
jgi:CRISPR-associated protein Cas1